MEKETAQLHRQLIRNAQILFKFSFGISATHPELGYLTAFSSYHHTATQSDLRLTQEEEFKAASLLEHVAVYILAVQVQAALLAMYPKTSEFPDPAMKSAMSIARLIRNAFAHNPFAPEWKIPKQDRDQQLCIPGIISLSTKDLNGKYVTQEDYEGPLALLKLSELVRARLDAPPYT